MADSNLDVLFPLPSPPPTTKCPARLPGITHETKIAVTKTLKENHVQRGAFINEEGFHKYAAPPGLLYARDLSTDSISATSHTSCSLCMRWAALHPSTMPSSRLKSA